VIVPAKVVILLPPMPWGAVKVTWRVKGVLYSLGADEAVESEREPRLLKFDPGLAFPPRPRNPLVVVPENVALL
jgi:hypothetical protein